VFGGLDCPFGDWQHGRGFSRFRPASVEPTNGLQRLVDHWGNELVFHAPGECPFDTMNVPIDVQPAHSGLDYGLANVF